MSTLKKLAFDKYNKKAKKATKLLLKIAKRPNRSDGRLKRIKNIHNTAKKSIELASKFKEETMRFILVNEQLDPKQRRTRKNKMYATGMKYQGMADMVQGHDPDKAKKLGHKSMKAMRLAFRSDKKKG
jgi:hypothetical protein